MPLVTTTASTWRVAEFSTRFPAPCARLIRGGVSALPTKVAANASDSSGMAGGVMGGTSVELVLPLSPFPPPQDQSASAAKAARRLRRKKGTLTGFMMGPLDGQAI